MAKNSSLRPAVRWLTLLLVTVMILSASSSPARSQALGSGAEKLLVTYSQGSKAAVAGGVRSLGGTVRFEFDSINVLAITLPGHRAAALGGHPAVLSVAEDPEYQLFNTQTVPYGIDMVQARDTWDADRDGVLDAGAPTGSGIRVCIVDTGILADHEDLGGGGVTILAGRSWVDEDWSRDGHGHGTHVAGTVAAMHNEVGVVGVSPGQVALIIADVFNDAGDSQDSSVILNAANWCADQGANIISMSLGGPIGTLAAGYQALYDRGILVVAAAGNDGGPVNNYPASYPSVMSIAAVDSSATVADFSNFVPEVELAAPGVSVLSTWAEESSVAVADGPKYSANPVQFADPSGSFTGMLADGGDCNLPVAPGAFQGQLVLCERGGLPFKAKIDNAASGGAIGVILYNNEPGNFSGTYAACCSPIPSVSVGQDEGQDLVNNWLGSNVIITIHAESNAGYTEISGTSMATPHASGVAAVLWSACPALTNDQIRSHLDTFTMEPEADLIPGRDIFYGYGIPQLKDAVDGLFDGVDEYDPNQPNSDGSRPANVECPTLPGVSAKGSGWLERNDGKKINFGFDVEVSASGGSSGSLRLNDKATGVKIDITGISGAQDGRSSCSEVTTGDVVLELTGQGTINGAGASFRACAADSGNPGKGQDQFYLACTSGCSYDTASLTQDNVIDGGNIQVHMSNANEPSEPAASVLILDPLLLTEGIAGQLQVFTVSVYDQNGQRLANAPVTLRRANEDGSTENLAALSDLTGTAVFSLVNLLQMSEYIATSGSAESNAIEVSPLLR